MVQIYGLHDNILKDDSGTSIMAFIDALVLSTAGHPFDSHYDETNDNESNAASRISTMVSAYFDYEYQVIKSKTSRTSIFYMIRGTYDLSALCQEILAH